jgi:hypothetical protein
MIGIVVESECIAASLRKRIDREDTYVFGVGAALLGRQFDDIFILAPYRIPTGEEGKVFAEWLKSLECKLKPGGRLIGRHG